MAGTPKLIILSEPFRGKTFELTKDLYTIGRVEERDICIPDPAISTYHCALVRKGDTYIVKDQGSTNGTRINYVPATDGQELQNSDVIQIGGTEMLYDCADKSGTTIMKTATNININAAQGTKTLERIERAGFAEKQKSNGIQKIMIALIILLALIVIALAIFLVIMIIDPQAVKNLFA